MADPGFPRGGGRQLPRGAPTYDFAKNSQKLHEIERIWAPRGGGVRPKFYYVDPPLTVQMRRYPWGDTVISLHTPAPNLSHGGGVTPDQLNLNSLNLAKFSIGGGYSKPTQIQSPSIWPSFHFRGRGWWWWWWGGTPGQLNSKFPQSGLVFIFREVFQTNSNPTFQTLTKFSFSGEGKGGEGVLQTNIPQILEWGHPRNFEPKILVNGMW